MLQFLLLAKRSVCVCLCARVCACVLGKWMHCSPLQAGHVTSSLPCSHADMYEHTHTHAGADTQHRDNWLCVRACTRARPCACVIRQLISQPPSDPPDKPSTPAEMQSPASRPTW